MPRLFKKNGFLTENFYCKCFIVFLFSLLKTTLRYRAKIFKYVCWFTVLGKNSSLFSLLLLYYGKAVWSSSLLLLILSLTSIASRTNKVLNSEFLDRQVRNGDSCPLAEKPEAETSPHVGCKSP